MIQLNALVISDVDKCLLMLQNYGYFVVKIFVSNKYVKIWVDCSLHGNTNSKELMFYKPNNIITKNPIKAFPENSLEFRSSIIFDWTHDRLSLNNANKDYLDQSMNSLEI